ncbi:MAG: site-specific integrase [Bdellovibrionales bacterium]|nr:site-specific integrase [Bdellovibrionales bacterium]
MRTNKPIRHGNKWRIRWIDESGTRRSEVYEKLSDAEFELQRRLLEVAEINRGLRIPIVRKKFSDLAEYWSAHRCTQKKSGDDDRSILNAHLLPAFQDLLLEDINILRIDRFKQSKTHLSPKTVNNHLALLRAMLNLAIELHWLKYSPKIKLARIDSASSNYRYLQTRDEIGRFLQAAEAEGKCVHALYSTAVYTGLRAGELANLSWSDVTLDGPHRTILVRRGFKHTTKSGKVRRVPIPNTLLPILRQWRLGNPLKIVFPNRAGHAFGESARVFQETFQRTLDRAGFTKSMTSRGTKRALVFHDLRHSYASHFMMNGGQIFKLQRYLGHQSLAMTNRYAHLSPEAFADDYDRFGDEQPPGRLLRLQKEQT